MVITSYGAKDSGESKFVIVAPHAAGDDINTGPISNNIAYLLKAYRVVNNEFVKPRNSRAISDGSNVEDFNRLSWNRNRYVWDGKKSEMSEFYNDIRAYAEDARRFGHDRRAVVAYIHGMEDRPDFLAIDIGCGLKYDGTSLKGTNGTTDKHPEAGANTGVVRGTRQEMRQLQADFDRRLASVDQRFRTGIGEYKAAWSRSNGIQWHAGTYDASFQLEINKTLRDNPEGTSRIIADALRRIYSQ
ncbi:MAG TPA: hypothetical protein VJH04_03110 [archaeon]|nr:hypothetical protein [archaeon]